MTPRQLSEVCHQLTALCWEVAKRTGTHADEATAIHAAKDLHGLGWAVVNHSATGTAARSWVALASGLLAGHAEAVAEVHGVGSFTARLWRELADAAADVGAVIDDDRAVNPDDVCRDPQGHLDYLHAALQVPDELVERWRALVEDHSPAEALRLVLDGGDG